MVTDNYQKILEKPVYRHLEKFGEPELVFLYNNSLNIGLTLNRVNAARILARFSRNPAYPNYQAAIIAALTKGDVRAQMDKYFEHTLTRVQRFGLSPRDEQKTNFNLRDVEIWAKLKFLSERMSLSTENWWMTLEHESFSGSDGLHGLAHEMRVRIEPAKGCDSRLSRHLP